MSNHPDIKNCWGIVDDGVPMEHCKKHNQIYKNYCSKCVIEENEKLREAINRWVRSPCHGHCSCGNCGALISISRETEEKSNG